MKQWQKVLAGAMIIAVVLIVLDLMGIIQFHPGRRGVYAGCDSGCTSNTADTADCAGLLVYLKGNQPQFVSYANALKVNIDKPDEIVKTVSSDGHIRCWYYTN